MRKINLTKSPESHCPRFNECSINKCPLHKDYSRLLNFARDPSKIHKEKCTDKRIRKEIGKSFGLKFGGMTSREYSGTNLWASTHEGKKIPQNDFKSKTHIEQAENEQKVIEDRGNDEKTK